MPPIVIPVAVAVAVTVSVAMAVTMPMAVTMAVTGKCCRRDQQRGSGSRDKEKFANH
jgi:hypothetical protein